MKTKICFKCGKEKPITDFYLNRGMADGHINKCNECARRDERERYEKKIQSKEWADKERARGREKYHRLYAERHLKSSHSENSTTRKFLERRGIKLDGMEVHHWNYNQNKDVFLLTPRQHKKAHKELVFDKETNCFKHNEVLLDTSEKHLAYIREILGTQDITHLTF